MSSALDLLAHSQLSYSTGTAGTVTVEAGRCVTRVMWFVGVAASTLTITPKGPNQTSVEGAAIPLPAGSGWGGVSFLPGELGPGTILVFASTTSYIVFKAKI